VVGDTANVSDTLDLQPGQIFAGWRIERELARGGMGVLYLAHHPRLPRTDVIKVLSPMLSTDQRFRERFLREVTRMSTLSHPHLMTIHDSGESENGILYLVMPFISGGDLRALLKQGGPLPPGRAAKIITQLGAALDAAHRVGVVHRDVKPENVLLAAVEPDDTDHAVLTDFGISREDMASNTLTATGELLLTPAYASPEQVLGQVVDARADQYALACILYELLTGEPPYRNDVQVAMLMAHVQEPIPRIGGRFGLPRAIDDVIARGMAKSAAERFPNCRALAQAATAALGVTADVQRTPEARETMLAPPPSPPQAYAPAPPQYQPPQHQQHQYQPPPGQGGYPGQPQSPTPFYSGTPSQQQKHTKRNVLIALLVLIVAGGAAAGIILGTKSNGSGSKANTKGGSNGNTSAAAANFSALLTRVPQSVRSACTDDTAQLPSNAKPFVQVLARCKTIVNGAAVAIEYRTLLGDANNIRIYRMTHLGLGGSLHSPGDCKDFLSADPNLHGTRGFAENVNSPPLIGGVWCNTDGTLWYEQTSQASGHLPMMTKVVPDAGNAGPPQTRYTNLEAVAPTS
jgi:serine/threonine protein kinase